MSEIEKLRRITPWPEQKPDIPFNDGGWFPKCNRQLLSKLLSDKTSLVVELGSWIGLSTRWILDTAPNAKVIAIDHWLGGKENAKDPLLPVLHDTFISNCWSYKDRLVMLKMDTLKGMRLLLDNNVRPNVIYVDAGHDYESANADLKLATLFDCPIVGDDFNPNAWPGVVRAVWERATDAERNLYVMASGWYMPRKGEDYPCPSSP